MRSLSPVEKAYLAVERVVPPFAVQVVIEGVGVVGIADLEDAVRRVAQAYPGYGVVRKRKRWVAAELGPLVEEVEGRFDLAHPVLQRRCSDRKRPPIEHRH